MRIRHLFLATACSTLVACGSGSDSGVEGASVTSIFTDEQFSVFETLGLLMNQGVNPPLIEGTFRIDPRTRQATSTPNIVDGVGDNAFSQNITFSNQNIASQTLEVTTIEDNTDPAAFGDIVITGSSISGSGSAFTALFIMNVTFGDLSFTIAQGFSGIVTDAGIENLQQVNAVLDDGGDPDDFLIPNNTGDLFIDLDGFSERL